MVYFYGIEQRKVDQNNDSPMQTWAFMQVSGAEPIKKQTNTIHLKSQLHGRITDLFSSLGSCHLQYSKSC